MPVKTIEVGIAPDAIEKIAKVSVERAVEELIWNALDAEATRVEVSFRTNELDGIEAVVVADNGHGITPDQAEVIFRQIGGSPKKARRRSPKLDRPYHGQDGEGRYKAFSIGHTVVWSSRAMQNGVLHGFSVRLNSVQIKKAEMDTPAPCGGEPGCEVLIQALRDNTGRLRSPACVESLAHRLAPYLMAHPDIRVVYDGALMDIRELLLREESFDIRVDREEGEPPLTAKLRVLEWKKARKASMYYCDSNGVALEEVTPGLREGRFSFTAYLLSDRLRQLHDQDLLLEDLMPEVRTLKTTAADSLREYFRKRLAQESASVAQRIKSEGLYPYSTVPATPVEEAEQQVFDVCAATVHEYLPEFEGVDRNARRLTYKLLREALEQNPSNLNTILAEVFRLTEEQREDLAHLLKRTTLGAIIHTAKTITDRLAFINGLEQILHDATIRKMVKERTQLHRILVDELWLFGDGYALGADDVSLRTVLQEHCSILGLGDLTKQLTKPESDDLADVPDLLLWQQYVRGKGDEFEHLVIELKRPTVRISLEEINQVKRYATKVLDNRFFDKQKTRWTFIVVNDDVADEALEDVSPRDREPGHVHMGTYHDVWVVRWAEVIQKAKTKLKYLQEKLNVAVSDNSEGRGYLRTKYAHLLPGAATTP